MLVRVKERDAFANPQDIQCRQRCGRYGRKFNHRRAGKLFEYAFSNDPKQAAIIVEDLSRSDVVRFFGNHIEGGPDFWMVFQKRIEAIAEGGCFASSLPESVVKGLPSVVLPPNPVVHRCIADLIIRRIPRDGPLSFRLFSKLSRNWLSAEQFATFAGWFPSEFVQPHQLPPANPLTRVSLTRQFDSLWCCVLHYSLRGDSDVGEWSLWGLEHDKWSLLDHQMGSNVLWNGVRRVFVIGGEPKYVKRVKLRADQAQALTEFELTVAPKPRKSTRSFSGGIVNFDSHPSRPPAG
jgi:hypothetical protein